MNSSKRVAERRLTAVILVLALLAAGALLWLALRPAGEAIGNVLASDGRGSDDGEIPEGEAEDVNSSSAALAGLDADLRDSLREAAAAAAADGITLRVTSGWRSAAYQQRLFDEAVQTYGSREEAAAWVAEPHRSAHVQGLAVDVGPTDAYSWLDQHGAAFGLCRVFANEGWHFEKRDLDENGWCPALLPSAADDDRSWPQTAVFAVTSSMSASRSAISGTEPTVSV